MSVPAGPQEYIDLLRRRLALHALWQSGLVFLPPLLAAWYIVFFLYRFAWLDPDAVMISGAAFLIAAAALTAVRFRAHAPSPLATARLIDETAAAEDRFVTLATVEGASGPAEFFSRLNSEAVALARTIDFQEHFPFRAGRSMVNSIIAALTAVVIFQLAFELTPPLLPARPVGKLAAAGQKLAGDLRFAELAAALSAAAEKLEGRSLSAEEKQTILRDILNQLDERIAREKARGGDISTLEEVAAEIRHEAKKNEESWSVTLPFKIPSLIPFRIPWIKQPDGEGGGGGKGSGGQGHGSQGEGDGAQKLEQKNGGGSGMGEQREGENPGGAKMQDGPQRAAGSEEKQQSKKTPDNRPDAQSNESRQLKDGGEKEGRKAATEKKGDAYGGDVKYGTEAKGELKGDRATAGAKSGEKMPARFAAPGEKPTGDLKDKDLRFVIVQLPEEESGTASGSREEQRKATAGALPSANVPLARPDDPHSAAEKQMLPLEYRGMIR